MDYAVIQIAGKQIKVAEGDSFQVNQMKAYNPVVLAFSQDGSLQLGTPTVQGVSVVLAPQGESKKKTTVFRYKSKSRYRKTKGHKQPLVTLKVESVSTDSKAKKTTKTKTSPKKEEIVEKASN